ncbi:hypothetical protein AURDEDRAFT_182555 [Auricularia subglabra TFB-10046 SS5]|nr:hypothetical protein AURDEDRAFT_182555 [Auricularia subglabra TFB-10046 SS5]
MSSDGRTVDHPPTHHHPMLSQAAPPERAPHADAEEQQNASLMAQTLNSDGTPKRPMNAFMIFARKRRPQVSAQNQLLRTGEISKILSREWNSMPIHDKQYYLDLAKRLKDNFNSKYPDYVYRRRPNNSRRRRRGEHRVGGQGSAAGDAYNGEGHDLDDDDLNIDEPDSPQQGYPPESHAPFHTQALPHPTILPTHQQPYYPQSSHNPLTSNVTNGLRSAPLPANSRQHLPHLYPVTSVAGPVSSVSTYSSSAPSPLSTHGHFSAAHSQNPTYSPTDSHPSSAGFPNPNWRDTRPGSASTAHSDSQSFLSYRTVSPSTSSYPMSGVPSTSGHAGSAAPSVSPTAAPNSKLRLLSTPFHPHPHGGGGYSQASGEHGGAPSSASSQSGSGHGSAAHSPSAGAWPRQAERGLPHPSPPIASGTSTPSPVVPTPFVLQPIGGGQQYQYPNDQLPPLASRIPPRVVMPGVEQPFSASAPYEPAYRVQAQPAGFALGLPHHIPSNLGAGSLYPPPPSSTGQQSAHSAPGALAYDAPPWAPARERLAQRDPSAADGGGAANGGGY